MYLEQHNKLAQNLEDISDNVVRTTIVPILTKKGILMGQYLIVPKDSGFIIKQGSRELYTVHSKSAAMIIAYQLSKKFDPLKIQEVIQADQTVHTCQNDLEVFKHHYERAKETGNSIRQNIFFNRFTVTDEKYQWAKTTLKKSYSLIF